MRTSGSIPSSTLPGPLPCRPCGTTWPRRLGSAARSFVVLIPRVQRALRHRHPPCAPAASQRAELQLLHRALGLANLPRHFLDAFLLHEAQHHHSPLFRRQSIDQPKQRCPALDVFDFNRRWPARIRSAPARPPTPRGSGAASGPKSDSPRCETATPQTESRATQIGASWPAHDETPRRQVFRLRPVSHSPHHVGIHALEIVLVKLGEARRVLLRRFDQKPLVRFFVPSLRAFNQFSARSSLTQR
jgi:hypothetical protein